MIGTEKKNRNTETGVQVQDIEVPLYKVICFIEIYLYILKFYQMYQRRV
jgi:hypothetical protein